VNQSRIACICLVLFGCLAGAAWAQKKAPGGVKVYLLSGGQRQHHGYRDQAFYLSRDSRCRISSKWTPAEGCQGVPNLGPINRKRACFQGDTPSKPRSAIGSAFPLSPDLCRL